MRKLQQNQDIDVRSGTIEQAMLRYGFGHNTMRKVAEQAGAIVKIGRCVRVNFSKMDKYIDSISGQ